MAYCNKFSEKHKPFYKQFMVALNILLCRRILSLSVCLSLYLSVSLSVLDEASAPVGFWTVQKNIVCVHCTLWATRAPVYNAFCGRPVTTGAPT